MIESMWPFVVLLFAVSFFGFSGIAHAYYDDSVVIEIGDILPHPSTSTSGSSAGSASPSGGSGSTVLPASSNPPPIPGSSSGSGPGGSPPIAVITTSGAGQASTSPGVSPKAEATLFAVLSTSGAITGSGAGSASGAASSGGGAGSSPSSGDAIAPVGGGSGVSGSGGGGGGSSFMIIDGAKIRKALLGKLSLKDILDSQRERTRTRLHGGMLSDQDLGLMAASTAIGDSNIEQITFGATRFQIVYRSEGYLFALIPKSFPVRVDINPQATGGDARVVIGLPWYRFFLRKLFNTMSLAHEIDVIVESDGSPQGGENANEVRARLFDKISAVLQNKIGTVSVPVQQ